MGLVTAYGSTGAFSRKDPGRVLGGVIVGTAVEVRIAAPFVSVKRDGGGKVTEIVDRDGRPHFVYRVLREGETEWVVAPSPPGARTVAIPLADVRQISYRRPNLVGTLVLLPVAGVFGVSALYALAFLLFGNTMY